MNTKQQEIFDRIKTRWESKQRGVYIDRSNSRIISSLEKMGLVEIWPYTQEYGNEAFLSKNLRGEK